MNANELADLIGMCGDGGYNQDAAKMLCQQQEKLTKYELRHEEQRKRIDELEAEIEALKKTCLDEITKRIYADQTTKVIEGYWEEAQAEIEALNRFIAERGETGQLIIWKAQEK